MITKKFIEENLLSKTGRLKRKVIQESCISEEGVYIKYYNIEKTFCNCGKPSIFKGFPKGFSKYCSSRCSGLDAVSKFEKFSKIKKEEITKEFIEKYILNKKGNLNANVSSKLCLSNEELYLIYYNIEQKICENKDCNNYTSFRKFSEGYYDFCSVKCTQNDEEVRLKQSDTLFEKYGTRDPLEIQDGRERGIDKCNNSDKIKREKTCMDKYGGTTSFHSKEVQDKVKRTFISNYGVDNPMFSLEFINDKFINILKEKRIPTYLSNFGVEHPMKIKDIIIKGNKKRRVTNEKLGNWITEDNVQDFKDYTKLVWRYRNQNDLSILENIDLRGRHSEAGYHLDHKYSIYQGFKDDIPAKIIGNICNLEMLISGQNLSKNRKCSITKDNLLSNFKLL